MEQGVEEGLRISGASVRSSVRSSVSVFSSVSISNLFGVSSSVKGGGGGGARDKGCWGC